MEKIYFLIASYGRTATYWLASSLHKHRDIACSHGATLSDFCMNYESPDVPDAKVLLSHKELDEFRKKSVDDFFDLLETKKKVKIYGNVHGYSAGDIWLMNSRHRIKRDIRVVNLMRHPITRIESLKRRFVYEFSFNPYLRKRVEEHFKKIVSSNLIEYVRNSFKVDLSHEANRLFLYSLSLVPLLDSEDMQTPYLQIPIERLVKDKECFCWVFNYLTKAGAPITKDYLDSVFSVNRMNSLNEESTSIEQFNSWDVWMR